MEKKNLQAGFARVDVTPSMDTPIIGYYIERKVEGVLDPLEVNAVAISCKEQLVVLLSVDNCGLEQKRLLPIRENISKKVGISVQSVFIHATHTHTGPGGSLTYGENDDLLEEYFSTLAKKCVDAACLAVQDLKPARVGVGVGKAEKVAFVRRFRMKDGTIQTNPGVGNPNIKEPLGEVDERVNVVRIDREKGESIVIVNFGNHPDTVGGSLISADWPGFVRKFVEKSIDNTKCIFFNGAQGDVNHVNVHPQKGDFNDLFCDFDGCSRGYGHARHIGRVIAGAVMQVYDKVDYLNVNEIQSKTVNIRIPSNRPTEEELPLARKYVALHRSGKDDEIPYKGMMLTTVVSEAERMLRLEYGPDYFESIISVIKIGDVAFVGLPGEPFTDIGRKIKETQGFELILLCCCVNDSMGYFPTTDAYTEGGYEARGSRFKAGVADIMIHEAVKLLQSL